MAAGLTFTPLPIEDSLLKSEWAVKVAVLVESHCRRVGSMPTRVYLPRVQYCRWMRYLGPMMSVWVDVNECESLEDLLVPGREVPGVLTCTMRVLEAPDGQIEPRVE